MLEELGVLLRRGSEGVGGNESDTGRGVSRQALQDQPDIHGLRDYRAVVYSGGMYLYFEKNELGIPKCTAVQN